ncbi:cytochrome c oxidase assembly protein, partial [Mycolicibacterium tokaiense]|uniref:cytochrome c oxidase assembly protein n=1 Tax=Mycolicibacterium tokaiense TaxID=39695 RepID=UPI0011C023F7
MWDQVGWLPPQPPSFATLLDWYPHRYRCSRHRDLGRRLYIAGVLRLHTLRRRWPWIRTVSFLAGCLTLAAVTGLAIEGYGLKLFSAFM